MKVVFTTPAIVFGAFGQAAEALVVSAGAAFFPKLLEVQVRRATHARSCLPSRRALVWHMTQS